MLGKRGDGFFECGCIRLMVGCWLGISIVFDDL